MCFVLSFGNLVLLPCFKSLMNMKNTHPWYTEKLGIERHSEGKWNNPLERGHTEAEARHRYSHNPFDLHGIILHGLALIAGHLFQHLNTILERRSDNHLVRIPWLRLLMITASVANVAVLVHWRRNTARERNEQVTVFSIRVILLNACTACQELLFGSQVQW